MFLDIIFIIILVFIVQYYIISMVKTNSLSNLTFSLNKIYLSLIMSFIISLCYVLLVDFKQGFITDSNYYIAIGICLGLGIYAYRNQYGITDFDWANSMIEIQSNGILISEKMANQNQNSSKCVEFAKYIVKAQEEQIDLLKQFSSESNTKGFFY